MKTILACLTTEAHADDILAAAMPLARRDMAHLIGLHTTEALVVYPGVAMHVPDMAYANFNASQKETSEAIETIFNNRVKAEDFASEWRSLRSQSTTAADQMVEVAREADLVVMAQADPDTDRVDQHHAQEYVIRYSGRPVLQVPGGYRGSEIGQSVVIGWSRSREAVRAVHDAIPLMAKGAKVAIVSVTGGDKSRATGATEMARALDRHGFSVEVVERNATKPADILNREALERGADMMVTGAFGHSRLYDFVVGAVTLDLMASATVPVMFSR